MAILGRTLTNYQLMPLAANPHPQKQIQKKKTCISMQTASIKSSKIPKDIIVQDINVPTAPKSMMVIKLRKNCFFFT